MENTNITILLTGATGLVGRHVAYELLGNIFDGKLDAGIFALVRGKDCMTPGTRIESLFSHPSLPDYLSGINTDDLVNSINIIEGDLRSDALYAVLGNALPRGRKIYVIDIAASTNLFRTERASLEVYENNYLGTINLIKAISGFEKKMIYISTAFAPGIGCGSTPGRPATDDEALFRSPYEYFKNKSERYLRDSVEQDGLTILRPSIVCGRMLDTPLYFTSKFDVFYGWAKFFYINRNRGERIRIFINTESGVNIIPVDYVAKAIVRSFLPETGDLNIVHSNSVSNFLFFSRILDRIQFTGYDFVDTMPDRLSAFERSYYATVGAAFTPYLISPPCELDASDIRSIMADTEEPDIIGHLDGILSYAIEREFRIESNPEKRVPALR